MDIDIKNHEDMWVLRDIAYGSAGYVIFIFYYFIIPIIASASVADDLDSGIARTYLALPITRKLYFSTKIMADIFVILICVNMPLWISYLLLGTLRGIWLSKKVLLLSIPLIFGSVTLYLVSLLWSVIQPYGTGSAFSAIITLNFWYFLPTFLYRFLPPTPDPILLLYSFTPEALLDYFYVYLYRFPFNDRASQIWLRNYCWVVRNVVVTMLCVGLFSLVMAYFLFSRKDL